MIKLQSTVQISINFFDANYQLELILKQKDPHNHLQINFNTGEPANDEWFNIFNQNPQTVYDAIYDSDWLTYTMQTTPEAYTTTEFYEALADLTDNINA